MGKQMSVSDKQKVMVSKEKCWESDLEMIKNCDKAPRSVVVLMSPVAKDKIDRLMGKFENIEWLAYLIGKDNRIDDIYIPSQVVSSGSVTNVDSSICNRMSIVGVIHSHHSMGNMFSKTDDDWINQNHDISLCVSRNGMNGQVRWKTPCGSLMVVKAQVKIDMNIEYDLAKFEEEINKNIKKEMVRSFSDNSAFDIMNENSRQRVVPIVFNRTETLEAELKYMEESGMCEDEDDEDCDLLFKGTFLG